MSEPRRSWMARLRRRRDPSVPDTAASAERRQMTVMFVDIAGSTEMSRHHEPEVVRDVTRRYQEIAAGVIGAHGGYVAQYAGDGILAYFGFPAAREDDARRAVRGALELRDAVHDLAEHVRREHGVALAVRIGLHTGLVLQGDMGSPDAPWHDAIIGLTPNQAQRVETIAPVGEVAISDETAGIVRGYFELESLGQPEMKGISPDVEVFRVVRATPALDRIQAAGGALTPLVGRHEELALLEDAWESLAPTAQKACAVRTVIVRGEAGIGKSRLALALAGRARDGGHVVFTAQCAQDGVGSPLFPIVRMLRSDLELDGLDDAARLVAIERACDRAGIADAVPLLAELVGLPEAAGYERAQVNATAKRARTFAAITAMVTAPARSDRVLLLVEDLHWADRTSIELLTALTTTAPAGGLLVLVTSRPGIKPPWTGPCHAQLDLGRLRAPEHEELIRTLGSIHGVDEELWGPIAERSDGNPLFTEELSKSLGHGAGIESPDAIPTTIRDLLTARLDALGDHKRLAQVAAVIGRDVDLELLREVTGLSRRQVTSGVAELVDAGIMQETGADDAARARFVHALVREAAYESQDRLHELRATHLRVAQALRDRPGADLGIVALHFDRAYALDEAMVSYQLAAEHAQESAADAEAVRFLDRALQLVTGMPDGAERDARELAIRLERGLSNVNLQGYAAPDAADDYRRALDLSERAVNDVALFPATAGIWAYYAVHGDLRSAGEAIDRLVAMDALEVDGEVTSCVGVQRFFEGHFAAAESALADAIAAFARRPDEAKMSPLWRLPNDPLVAALTHFAVVRRLAGDRAASDRLFVEAGDRANALAFPTGPFSCAYATSYEGWIANLTGRFDEARQLHERVIALGEEHDLAFWIATGTCHLAISRAHLGEPELAVAILGPAIEQWRALGAETFVPCFRTHLAEIRLGLGQLDEALADVDRAIAEATRTGEQWFVAESHRQRAAILRRLRPDDARDARAALDAARRVAAEQGALVFELRAALDEVSLDDEGAAPRAGEDDGRHGMAVLRDVVERCPYDSDDADVVRARSLVARAT